MSVGIIILVLVGLSFLGILAWFVTRLIKGPSLPKGHVFEATYKGKTATLIVDKKLPSLKNKSNGETEAWIVSGRRVEAFEIAQKCAMAIVATEAAFAEKGIKNATRDHVIFLFSTDKTFTSNGSFSQHAAAYSSDISGVFGIGRIDMAVIRTKYLSTVLDKGQPAVHELVHILNKAATGDYSAAHADPVLWLGPGGSTSTEGVGVANWAKMSNELAENK